MKLKLIFCLCMLPLLCLAQESQPQQFSNRYGMKMTRNDDGSYALLYAKKYAKFIDVNTIPDVMVPYTYQADRLKSKDYKGVTTKDIVYKKHKDYELILTVDFAETEKPAPFVVYIHGGGWARGNNGSSRSLSQYLAKQKGITGVRVSYTLAPQSDATVKVSIQDILDAVKYVQEHAAELNINPDCFGFLGTSAGAHLAAVAAMTVPGTKAFVGYSGIYNLEKAAITMKTKDPQRIAYFCDREPKVLREASPINLIPKKDVPAAEGAIKIAEMANKVRKNPLRVILNGLGKDAAQIISRINGFTYVQTKFDYYTGELKVVNRIAYSDGPRAKVNCYGADDVREGVAINWSEDVDVSITGNSTNPTRFQHPVAGTYKKERIAAGKPYFSVASGGGTGRTLHPDNMAAGPASYGMTDTMGRMHSDAQFAGSSSVPAHVEMMGFLGMGNNPMVGATVAIAVAIDLAINKK